MSPRIRRVAVSIVEHDGFWRATIGSEVADLPTAAEALSHVKALLAADGAGSSIAFIDWEPTTRVGRIVVEALVERRVDDALRARNARRRR